ncbi:hypothetical protein BOSP111201_08670 [Bordetella sputigena]|uniref:hypothetical protein n=1 Tax=Bordetella sputigena TaxID=1416810 RepID=UPI0039F124A2
MSIENTASAAYAPMDFTVPAHQPETNADAYGRGRRHAGGSMEQSKDNTAAAAFAGYNPPVAPPSEKLGAAEQIFDFTLNRALDLALPMSGLYDRAKCLYQSIKEGIAGPPGTKPANNTAADPVALSTGRPRRPTGLNPVQVDARQQSPARRADRGHPLADWISAREAKLYREILDVRQRVNQRA